jgi:kynurenine formamidase
MSRIVDLTMTIQEGMVTYPGHPHVEITQLARFGYEGKETRKVTLGTHTGTHIDAPRHFIEGGRTVENIPPEVLCGPARLLDLSERQQLHVDASALASAAHRGSVERVLLRFDGDKLLGSMDYYDHQPFLTTNAVEWLIDKGCELVGMDTPMPDNPDHKADMPIHKLLLDAGIVIVEYMVNLKAIQAETFQLVVAPLKIKNGDGAPARCFAVVDD